MTEVQPKTAPAAIHPCVIYRYHFPKPIRTQWHHSKPVYLQNRAYGKIVYPADRWVCGTCHDSIHTVIDCMLGEGPAPSVRPGRKIMEEARRTVAWYKAEMKIP